MVRAVPDPTPGTEASRFFAPDGRAAHALVDLGVDLGELGTQALEQTLDALPGPHAGTLLALAFGHDHLDDLPPPRHQIGQCLGGGIRQSAHRRIGRRSKLRNYLGVDPIGLGTLAQSVGKGAHLRRIDDHNGQARRRQARRHDRLKAACRLNRNELRGKRC
jgi:hypothetical protein